MSHYSDLSSPDPEEQVATYDEEREPDEWGDPGKLVSRKLLSVEPRTGYMSLHGRGWRLVHVRRLDPIAWME